MSTLFLLLLVSFVNGCYWNSHCRYRLFGSKTPYDTIRGDIRDYETPAGCEAVSIWILNRHGNRNPTAHVTALMKEVLPIKDLIISSYEQNKSEMCAQDVENYKKWVWNNTLDESHNFLTGFGYEELYNIGKRIRQKYSHLLDGNADEFYFRPTKEQRTITSCMAFVHGFTDGLDLNVTVEDPWPQDDVIRPYNTCERYLKDVKNGPLLAEQLETYFQSPDFLTVKHAVQKRLGISSPLSTDNIFGMYEICRFHRSWRLDLRDPWCAPFKDEDLSVLEYHDDVRHYYSNGYGSKVNVDLGKAPLKDMYEKLEAAVNGGGKKVVAYFTHVTMIGMIWCALGLYKDDEPLESLIRNPDRLWRLSMMGPFATSLIVVLNKCNKGGIDTFRVQIFINEKVTPICPVNGCKWNKFKEHFKKYTTSDLSFCNMTYAYPATDDPLINNAASYRRVLSWK